MAARSYKEMTLQQLRSFCETARLGSLTAAAKSLGLAHPTVWKQVHALERDFGERLVEPFGRGCRLTEAGRQLAILAGPAVANVGSLKQRYREARSRSVIRLNIVTTPRILIEDMPACVLDYQRRWPNVFLSFQGVADADIAEMVENTEIDIGLCTDRTPEPHNPWQEFELAYELDVVLVTPRDHPLAKRRKIKPEDLCAYPLLNAPGAWRQPHVAGALSQLDVYANPERRFETHYAASIRRYVQLGLGIGLIGTLPSNKPQPGLHERLMNDHFGRVPVYLAWRRGAQRGEAALAFADTIKSLLGQQPTTRAGRSRQPARPGARPDSSAGTPAATAPSALDRACGRHRRIPC